MSYHKPPPYDDSKYKQKQIKKLTKMLQKELKELECGKRWFGYHNEVSKIRQIEKIQEDKLKELDELKKELEAMSPSKSVPQNKESDNKKSSENAPRPLSEAEFNQWLKAQLEEIRKPICLVLQTANGLIRFSADKYEANTRKSFYTTITFEDFLRLKNML